MTAITDRMRRLIRAGRKLAEKRRQQREQRQQHRNESNRKCTLPTK